MTDDIRARIAEIRERAKKGYQWDQGKIRNGAIEMADLAESLLARTERLEAVATAAEAFLDHVDALEDAWGQLIDPLIREPLADALAPGE